MVKPRFLVGSAEPDLGRTRSVVALIVDRHDAGGHPPLGSGQESPKPDTPVLDRRRESEAPAVGGEQDAHAVSVGPLGHIGQYIEATVLHAGPQYLKLGWIGLIGRRSLRGGDVHPDDEETAGSDDGRDAPRPERRAGKNVSSGHASGNDRNFRTG
jgi:hypothetical protein